MTQFFVSNFTFFERPSNRGNVKLALNLKQSFPFCQNQITVPILLYPVYNHTCLRIFPIFLLKKKINKRMSHVQRKCSERNKTRNFQ